MNVRKQLVFGVITIITLAATASTTLLLQQSASAIFCVPVEEGIPSIGEIKDGVKSPTERICEDRPRAPMATSGENLYIAWWTNKTGNDEVQFRASNDAGTTFADKINLSNSTDAESQDVEIAAQGDNVIISWWERNQTAEEPVVRISTDNGATFGPLLKLASNGTIGGGE